MPKVSEEHRVARRAQIIDAARRRFAANGFHMTSMDDVIGESGLSAGALYRYFPSKDSLIVATIEDSIDSMLTVARPVFESAPDDPSLGTSAEQLLTVLVGRMISGGPGDFSRIVLYAWAEAPRSPAVADTLTARYAFLRATLGEMAAAALEKRGATIASDAREPLGRTMLAVMMGFITQRILLGDIAPSDIRLGLDTLVES